jgi:hypothetical protein
MKKELTNSTVLWNRVLLEKLIVSQVVQNVPAFY